MSNILKYDQVSLLTWEEGNQEPCLDYSVSIDSSSAIMRNPFSEKKWRKFQISRLFSSSNAATKLHVIDVIVNQGGTRAVDRWLVVLSLGSGQTRNMALDRYAKIVGFVGQYSIFWENYYYLHVFHLDVVVNFPWCPQSFRMIIISVSSQFHDACSFLSG